MSIQRCLQYGVRPISPRPLGQCGALLLLLFLAVQAFALEPREALWRYADADTYWPSVPNYSEAAQAIQINASALANLRVGDRLVAPAAASAGDKPQAILITRTQDLINGDTSVQGELIDGVDSGPFVLTMNAHSVFAYIEIGAVVWQIDVSRANATGPYRGWLYQSAGLDAAHLQTDFRIPERKAPAVPSFQPQIMPLTLADAAPRSAIAQARNGGINATNFAITQTASRSSVVAGAKTQIRVDLHNTSKERHDALTLDLYFILENSTLVEAPATCRQRVLGAQKILQCALGSFAPGESKALAYTVSSSASSKPRLVSTAMVGGLRHDVVVNVVEDVVSDSDGDGISDFNERLLGTNPFDAASKDNANSIIDVLTLYSPGANALSNGQAQTRINHLIAIANQIYADSGVRITLRPVHHALVHYNDALGMDAALVALTDKSDPAFARVDALRDTYGADLVIMFRPLGSEQSYCGLANQGGSSTQGDMISSNEKAYAYSVVGIDCPVSSVVAHELGHNMGLTHSHREDDYGGTFDFATGYGVDGLFSTVMARPGAFNAPTRLPRFSTPLLNCLGEPCGRAESESSQPADAVRALNITRHQVARYYPTRVPYLPDHPLATLSGTPTNARIAAAASVDKGLSYVNSVRPSDKIDVNLSLFVDSRDAGKQGDIFVLATLDGAHYLQLDSQGGSTAWDGSVSGLHAYRPRSELAPVEYLQVVNAASLGVEFINKRVQIFIAYSVSETGELIYTAQPLTIDITP